MALHQVGLIVVAVVKDERTVVEAARIGRFRVAVGQVVLDVFRLILRERPIVHEQLGQQAAKRCVANRPLRSDGRQLPYDLVLHGVPDGPRARFPHTRTPALSSTLPA